MESEKTRNICEDCIHYFSYMSVKVSKPKDEEVSEKNIFSTCLVSGFSVQSNLAKNFTQSCSQFTRKRRF